LNPHTNPFSTLPRMSHCFHPQLNTVIAKHSPHESFFPTSRHVSLFGPTAQHRYHQTLTTRIVFPHFLACLIIWTNSSTPISPNTNHTKRFPQPTSTTIACTNQLKYANTY